MAGQRSTTWFLTTGPRRLRELRRLREIVRVLGRNGLDVVVEQLRMVDWIPRRLLLRFARPRPEVGRMGLPQRVRQQSAARRRCTVLPGLAPSTSRIPALSVERKLGFARSTCRMRR